jgi:Flp pilus assembly protein TadG
MKNTNKQSLIWRGMVHLNKNLPCKFTYCRGQSLLEFALVLPFLLLIAFGIIEFGRAYYQYNTLNKAIRDGARYLSRHSYIDTEVANAANICVYGNTVGNGTPVLPGLTSGSITVSPAATGYYGTGTTPPKIFTVSVINYHFTSMVPRLIPISADLSPTIQMRFVGPNADFSP